MEKHRCKLCCRKFSNGRALGGHMRSHMMNLHVPSKPESRPSYESSLPSSSSSSSDSEPEEGEIVKDRLMSKLRKKPRKIVKLLDETVGSSSVTLQDRGSDTESSKNVTRRRSKRTRKLASSILQHSQHYKLLCDDDIHDFHHNDVDQQLGSSISEVTSEEDVAFCLMMMSRDTWSDNGHGFGYGYGYEKDFSNNDDDIVNMSHKKKYKCETCNKVFKSYQALGGHRASHKKTRATVAENARKDDNNNDNTNVVVVKEEEKKIHECPICFRVFASGQALGGHKRSHGIGNGGGIDSNPIQSQVIVQSPKKKKKIIDEILIDLNLPAPIDDDYDEDFISQIATSAVSDVHL